MHTTSAVVDENIVSEEEYVDNQYSLIRDRAKKTVRPPQRYGYSNYVTYALSVVETVEYSYPVTYKDVSSNDSKKKSDFLS